jgi:hypothetical protein
MAHLGEDVAVEREVRHVPSNPVPRQAYLSPPPKILR